MWLWVFLLVFVSDVLWTLCVDAVKHHKALAAGNLGLLYFLVCAAAIIGYTEDKMLLIPGGLGAWLGTYAGVWWNERKKR